MKKVKSLLIAIGLLFIATTVISANALTNAVYTNNSWSISAGGSKTVNFASPYNTGYGTMTVDSITSGTESTTVFYTFKMGGGAAGTAKTSTVKFRPKTCVDFGIGNIGFGRWSLENRAYSGNTQYAGWSGKLEVFAS